MKTRATIQGVRPVPSVTTLVLLVWLPLVAFGQSVPAETKLLGRATTPQAGNEFGTAVAVSDRFLLVGEPGNNDVAADAGAAHLFDALTGRPLRKLTASDGAAGDLFGYSVALSGHLALVGAPFDDDNGNNAGSAYLFDVRSGKQLRKLKASDGAARDYFGWSVALSGHLALAGAPGDGDNGSGSGSAYLFDVRSGFEFPKLKASDGAAGDRFGTSVALSGHLALAGAYGDDDDGSSSGSAYLFDVRSGFEFPKLKASDGAAGDFFGLSVALSGHLALAGAPFDNDNGSDSGSAYLFDVRTGAQFPKLKASDGAADDYFGYSVALSGNLALLGAYRHAGYKGAAYVFDARSGATIPTGHAVPGKLIAADGAADDRFGRKVALSGNLALASAPYDDDNGSNSGSAYFIRPLAAPLPLARVATQGASAPASGGAMFKSFPQAFINADGETCLQATLSGAGAGGGRSSGVWTNLSGSLGLGLRLKDTDLGDGRRATKIHSAWGLNGSQALIQATLSGRGVNSGNNQAVFRDNGADLLQVARSGETFGGHLGGAAPRQFLQVAQNGGGVAAYRSLLSKGSGVGSGNDSAIFFVANATGAAVGGVFREGVTATSAGGTLGQLFPRVAMGRWSNSFVFGAARIPADGGAARQAVFRNVFSDPVATVIAEQGGNAPGTGMPPASFRSFLAEGASDNNGRLLWRATLAAGPGVSSKTNEGLWHGHGSDLVARKGQEIDPAGLPGVRIARLLQFWPGVDVPDFGVLQALVLVKLSGPKVGAANDLALCFWQINAPDALTVLLREDQPVEGTDGPAVRVIQRVDVDSMNGHYAVLCSLTGSASANQALFTGQTFGLLPDGARLPAMKLRKGVLHTLPATTTTARLTGISLPVVTDQTGAGGKGLGQVINSGGQMALTLSFSNKAVEVLSGVP